MMLMMDPILISKILRIPAYIFFYPLGILKVKQCASTKLELQTSLFNQPWLLQKHEFTYCYHASYYWNNSTHHGSDYLFYVSLQRYF